LIHTNICEPITPESFSGKRHFITFIDDFSRKTLVSKGKIRGIRGVQKAQGDGREGN